MKAIVELDQENPPHSGEKDRGKTGRERITLSVNSFVPKPGTPFQWHPFEEVRRLQEKIKGIRNGLKQERGIEVAADIPKWAYLQTLLSRGDRRVGRLLLAAHQLGGNWPQVFREADLNPDFYVYRPADLRGTPSLGLHRPRDQEGIPMEGIPGSPERRGRVTRMTAN